MSEYVVVKRELLERMVRIEEAFSAESTSIAKINAACAEDEAILKELRAILAQEAGKVEPVATILCPDPYDERQGAWMSSQDLRKLEALPVGTKLYTAPVAVVLPDRKTELDQPQRLDSTFNYLDGQIDGWNACLDKVKEMNR